MDQIDEDLLRAENEKENTATEKRLATAYRSLESKRIVWMKMGLVLKLAEKAIAERWSGEYREDVLRNIRQALALTPEEKEKAR